MDSLADKVIAANSEQRHSPSGGAPTRGFFNVDFPEIDEYGLPTIDSVDYFVARTILIDQKSENGHLHLRDDGKIWKGHQWVAENTENLYRFCEWRYPIKTWQKEAIWKRLREVLPRLSRDKYVITDKLVWDRTKTRLEWLDNKPNTIK